MFALTLFVVYFCLASCLLYDRSNQPSFAVETAQDSDIPEMFQGLYEAYFGESEDVEVLDDNASEFQETIEVTENEQSASDDITETDDSTWETFSDLSLTAIRKIAKTLAIPRYTRLDRDELVWEINLKYDRTPPQDFIRVLVRE